MLQAQDTTSSQSAWNIWVLSTCQESLGRDRSYKVNDTDCINCIHRGKILNMYPLADLQTKFLNVSHLSLPVSLVKNVRGFFMKCGKVE